MSEQSKVFEFIWMGFLLSVCLSLPEELIIYELLHIRNNTENLRP